MAPFGCPNCHRLIHFEVRVYPDCAFTFGYDPTTRRGSCFSATGRRHGATRRRVARRGRCARTTTRYGVCNWLVTAGDEGAVPRLPTQPHDPRPQRPERARALGQDRGGQATDVPHADPARAAARDAGEAEKHGINRAWHSISSTIPSAERTGQPQMITGHDGGLVTLNLIEADDASARRSAARWTSRIAPCSAISAMRSAIITGRGWSSSIASELERVAARSSATRRSTMPGAPAPLCQRQHRRLDRRCVAPMRRCIPGRISPRPSRIISTSSIRWRRSAASAPRWRRPRARGASRRDVDFDPYRAPTDELIAQMDAVHLRAQRGQPQHGPARSLPVPPVAGDRRQDRLRQPPDRATIRSGSTPRHCGG